MTSTSNMDCRVSINTVKPANDIKLKMQVGLASPHKKWPQPTGLKLWQSKKCSTNKGERKYGST